jgi:hypothetical protein
MNEAIARYTIMLQRLMERPWLPFDNQLRPGLPMTAGVYRILETNGQETVYIGRSMNLQNRIYRNHLMGNRRASTLKNKLINCGICIDENTVKDYLCDTCLVQFLTIEDAAECKSFEHFAIAILRPKHND